MDLNAVRPKLNSSTQVGGSKPLIKRCPIYVHKSNITKSSQDISEPKLQAKKNVEQTQKPKTLKKTSQKIRKQLNSDTTTKPKSENGKISKKNDVDKIEETYWSQWKPNQTNDGLIDNAKVVKRKIKKKPKQVKGEGDVKKEFSEETIKKDQVNTELIETKKLAKIDEITDEDIENNFVSSQANFEEGDELNIKFLKHTDSFILITKQKADPKPRYQQPKCIRLFKKTTATNFSKGNTYPLRSCLKKEHTKINNKKTLSGVPYGYGLARPIKK